jgi:ATP-dependent exoDNAse (exonuclease V) beta subunit
MLVLCRTRSQVQKISRALAQTGLPIGERSGIFEQEHIKNVVSILLLMSDLSGSGLLRLARQSEHLFSQDDFEALFIAAQRQKTTPGVLVYNAEPPLTMSVQGRESLLHLSDIWHNLQFNKTLWGLLAQYLFLETKIMRDLLSAPNPGSSIADYDTLLQLARHYDQQRSRNNEATQKEQALDEQIRGFLEYLSLLVLLRQDGANRQQSDEEDDAIQADRLRVMTVHASKGLEFPIVYMPGLVQQRFPTIARSGPITTPKGMADEPDEESKEQKNKAHESSESCLFYVGVTRARDHVILSYSERYGKRNYKRSPYLDALEAGLDEGRITKIVWTLSSEHSPQAENEEQHIPVENALSASFVAAMQPANLTANAIEAYLRCPRQYAYRTLYHLGDDADGYLLFWQATQKTVEVLRNQLQGTQSQSQALSAEEIRALYTQHWQELEGPKTPFATFYERHGHEVVEAAQHDLASQQDASWELRSHYPIEVSGKTVQVTIDRVEHEQQSIAPQQRKQAPASSPEAPSFKRTRFGKRKDKPTAETRDLFYTLAYRQHFPDATPKLYSHNMSTGETTPITMTTKKEQSLYEEVVQAVQAMELNEFPARPAEPMRCPTCPFFMICPA